MGSIQNEDIVKGFLQRVENQFTRSYKTYAIQMIRQLVNEKYTGGGIRAHILKMNNLAEKLKTVNLKIDEDLLVHFVLLSLPDEFENFVSNYNINPDKWTFEQLIVNNIQEEDKFKAKHGGSIHYVKDNKNKDKQQPQQKKLVFYSKPMGKQQHRPQEGQAIVDRDTCMYCGKKEHYKKNCLDWLKLFMKRNGVQYDENHGKMRRFDKSG